jgi:hypothetical protein
MASGGLIIWWGMVWNGAAGTIHPSTLVRGGECLCGSCGRVQRWFYGGARSGCINEHPRAGGGARVERQRISCGLGVSLAGSDLDQ